MLNYLDVANSGGGGYTQQISSSQLTTADEDVGNNTQGQHRG